MGFRGCWCSDNAKKANKGGTRGTRPADAAPQPAAGMHAYERKRKFEPSAAEAGSGVIPTFEAALAGPAAPAAHSLLSTMCLSGPPAKRPADRACPTHSNLNPLMAACWVVPDESYDAEYAAAKPAAGDAPATMPEAESWWRGRVMEEHLSKLEHMDTQPRLPAHMPEARSRWREQAMERLSVLERMATLESQGACKQEVERRLHEVHQMWLQRQKHVDELELQPALKMQVNQFLADWRKLQQKT